MKPFDPNDRRCIFPRFGQQMDAAMQDRGYNNTSLAGYIGVDHTAVAGYRRGFSRPSDPVRISAIEALLGVKLIMDEPTPTEKRRRAATVEQPDALMHLSALALALGYRAVFTPVTA